MDKIDIQCNNCKQILNVDRTPEIPKNVKMLLCNYCPICPEDDIYNEEYIYYELGELEKVYTDPNQTELF